MYFTKKLLQIHQAIGSRIFSGFWFGLFASIITIPLVFLLYPSNSESISDIFVSQKKLMALEFLLPIVMTIISGMIFGPAILNKDVQMSDFQAFNTAVRISMIAAALSLLAHIILSAFFDLQRAPIVAFLFFGAPFYGVIAGLSGSGLRSIGKMQT